MRQGLAARAESLLARHWWRPRPSLLMRLLQPLALLYGLLAARQHRRTAPQHAPVPVLVVGNFVVGGAGKTPTVIAVVQALQRAGHRPGVLSRGFGRQGDGVQAVQAVQPGAAAADVGDEPLLIQRRTGVPVWVGRQRVEAARALCAAHPEVDVLVCDDGLQHHALARDAELVIFDDRGAGNGLLLPAGPLREPLPDRLPLRMRLLYTGTRTSTPLAGVLAQRRITQAWPLAAWWAGDSAQALPLGALQGRPLLAAAGLADPSKFFSMLEAMGLRFERLPLPDHFSFHTRPWSANCTDVLVTEKDAVKLPPLQAGATRVWVVPLDFQLPVALIADLSALLFTQDPHHPPP